MLMKDGTVVPKPLADALALDASALKVFMGMSVAYQQLCVAQMKRSDEASRKKRVQTAMDSIRRYGETKTEL